MVLGARDVLPLIRLCKPTTLSVILHKSRSNPLGTYYLDGTKALHLVAHMYLRKPGRDSFLDSGSLYASAPKITFFTHQLMYICLCLVFSPPPLPRTTMHIQLAMHHSSKNVLSFIFQRIRPSHP